MAKDAAQPAVAVEITASAVGTLMLGHRITTDPGDPRADLLQLSLEIRPNIVDDCIALVDCLVETDDEALAISIVGLDRAGLDAYIAYLTAARDEWQAAA